MRPTRSLPATHRSIGTLDVRRRLPILLLSLGGLILLPLCYELFNLAARRLGGSAYADALNGLSDGSLDSIVKFILGLLLVNLVMLVLHEGMHGIFLAGFTRTRPEFALKSYYAYAAAPGWYFPRAHYLVVSLAPLVLISLLGTALMPVVPVAWLPALVGLLTFNAAGSVGDLAVFFWLLVQPASTYAYDTGDTVTLFGESRET